MFFRSIVVVLTFFIALAPAVRAANGSGVAAISPNVVVENTAGNTFTIEYQAVEALPDGGLRFTAPSGWSSPQGTLGLPGYTTVSATAMLASVEHTMDSGSGWLDNSLFFSTIADTSVKKAGSASVRTSVHVPSADAGRAYYNYASSQDWSSVLRAGFWIYTERAFATGGLTFIISESEHLPDDASSFSIALPAIGANAWSYVIVDMPTQPITARDAVLSYGFQFPADTAYSYYIDTLSLGPASLAFTSSTAEAQFFGLACPGAVEFIYGASGGASGVTVPFGAGSTTMEIAQRVDTSGTFTTLASGSPIVNVNVTTTASTSVPIGNVSCPTQAQTGGNGSSSQEQDSVTSPGITSENQPIVIGSSSAQAITGPAPSADVTAFSAVLRDVDGDPRAERAEDIDRNSENGFEYFIDPDVSTTLSLTIDGDGDGRLDHFLDLDRDGWPNLYWDPDQNRTSVVHIVNSDQDIAKEYRFAISAASAFDRYYDPNTHTIVVTPAISGHLVKLPDDGDPTTSFDTAIYYIAHDGRRYVFPNEQVYRTWFTDFSLVLTLPSETLATFPIGGLVRVRPGTRMIKTESDPTVYAVAPGGVLRPITNEAVATALYGPRWQTLVLDVPVSLLSAYTWGDAIAQAVDFDLRDVSSRTSSVEADLLPP